ncbi:class I SAM-dependent methyltransferase [Pontibacillus marinus]|uniref:class I SAM-dependent methyltransferase n=1 Tax=Pontibacillus marinus TaxID=273164 RepID=UPI00041CFC75|nr:class I SAM-dependent methyltransferase [Pontibacillus marinus]
MSVNQNFFNELQPSTYATRQASPEWKEAIESLVTVQDHAVVDIGCGGGIYTKPMIELGAKQITCVDGSEVMLQGAKENLANFSGVSFELGDATATPLQDESADMVLERALIHHLNRAQFRENMTEVHRILQTGGQVILQDRTLEDCFLPPSKEHIRGYFFSEFPQLKTVEKNRRYHSNTVVTELHQAGFHKIKIKTIWETRKVFNNREELEEDLLNRTGRSILHDITDAELRDMIDNIISSYKPGEPIYEKDRWTIWVAEKA